MKNITLATLCAATATFAGQFITWNGADEDPIVKTGLGNETETQGRWYTYEDNLGSKTICPDDGIDPPYIYCADVILPTCQGFCSIAELDNGSQTDLPYVGFGFNVVGETSFTDVTPAAANVSAWGGLCVTYTSDADLQLELGLGPVVDSTINYANPAVTLPAAKATDILSPNGKDGNKVVVSWSDFKQPSWYDGAVKIDGETAAKHRPQRRHMPRKMRKAKCRYSNCSWNIRSQCYFERAHAWIHGN